MTDREPNAPLELPKRAQVVVIGGGIVGCSVAYRLTQRGWTDVVLLERNQLTSGTTWHAAGLVTTARPTDAMRQIVRNSIELFKSLEAETGLSTGYRTTGTIHLAFRPERQEELRRQAVACRASGLQVEEIDGSRATELFPLLDPKGIVGGLYFPEDGRGNATDSTMSLARGARLGGARIVEHCPVAEVITTQGRVSGVRTADGQEVETEYVVNCTGMWGRELAARAGVHLPLQALHHYYVITDEVPDLPRDMPTIKSPDDYSYVKDEAGKLMVGFFEPGSTPWAARGIPPEAAFTTLPENWDHIGPFYEKMTKRIPALEDVGIRLFFCGPESFTPDGIYHLGEVPGVSNYFVAAGFNSIGFLSGPGAGQALADWIVDGKRPFDLTEADPRRSFPHQTNRRYLEARVTETLDLAYEIHWPYEQRQSARGIRRSPVHPLVANAGAVFGEVAGWERANWYQTGQEPPTQPTFGRQHFFESVRREHLAVRHGIGMFDLSSFGKLLVKGPGAESLLQRVSANDLDVEPGRVVYTQWLNDAGGIEADVTVTRTGEDEFLVLTPSACVVRDKDWLEKNMSGAETCAVVDVSGAYAMFALMGPSTRDFLQPLTDADLRQDAFSFGSSKEIDLGLTYVRASRISYVGELGWELLVPVESAWHIFECLQAAGELPLAGYYALDTLRLEKAYRSFGHDIGPCDDPLEAGLGFAVAWQKKKGFRGRPALEEKREQPPARRLVQLLVDDPEVTLYHDEAVYKEGSFVGRVTSAGYGHFLERPVALAWVGNPDRPKASWFEGDYEVEVAGGRYRAAGSLRPAYDPKSLNTH